jgi:hypothetical protein
MYHPTHEEDTEAFAATEALKQRQIRIEAEQLQEAVEGYKQSFKHLSGMGKGTSMKSTQRLLLDWYEPLLQALENELKSIATGKVLADRRVIKPRSNYLLLALVSHILWVFFFSAGSAVFGPGTGGSLSGYHVDHHNKLCTAERQRRCEITAPGKRNCRRNRNGTQPGFTPGERQTGR